MTCVWFGEPEETPVPLRCEYILTVERDEFKDEGEVTIDLSAQNLDENGDLLPNEGGEGKDEANQTVETIDSSEQICTIKNDGPNNFQSNEKPTESVIVPLSETKDHV
jgi:hypothetical protein